MCRWGAGESTFAVTLKSRVPMPGMPLKKKLFDDMKREQQGKKPKGAAKRNEPRLS